MLILSTENGIKEVINQHQSNSTSLLRFPLDARHRNNKGHRGKAGKSRYTATNEGNQ